MQEVLSNSRMIPYNFGRAGTKYYYAWEKKHMQFSKALDQDCKAVGGEIESHTLSKKRRNIHAVEYSKKSFSRAKGKKRRKKKGGGGEEEDDQISNQISSNKHHEVRLQERSYTPFPLPHMEPTVILPLNELENILSL